MPLRFTPTAFSRGYSLTPLRGCGSLIDERVSSIPTKGGIHNLYVTPDSKYVIAGSISGKVMNVIDTKTSEIAWTLFNEGIRAMAIEANPDGSTKRVFVNVNNFHGFVVPRQ